jgi:adenosine deaminase
MNITGKINSLDCFIDLHLHLDGSVSVQSARELAVTEGVTLPDDDDKLKQLLMVSDDCRDLNEYLEKFSLPVSLMQSEETIRKSAYNLCCELVKHGLMYAEIRFAPQKHCLKGLSQKQVIEAAIEGIRESGFDALLILCCMRDGNDNRTENLETISLSREYLGKGVCACDLAGAEALFPNENYDYFFKTASDCGVPFTVHSGEALGAHSVYYALGHGAARIGHGVRAVEDELTLNIIVDRRIPLEICPTSNINTCVFDDVCMIPLPLLMDRGVLVTINTDNMSVSSTNIKKEYIKLFDAFDFDESVLRTLLLNSVSASFADKTLKERMIQRVNSEFVL